MLVLLDCINDNVLLQVQRKCEDSGSRKNPGDLEETALIDISM